MWSRPARPSSARMRQCVVTLNTEYRVCFGPSAAGVISMLTPLQRNFSRVMRSALAQVRGRMPEDLGEQHQRRRGSFWPCTEWTGDGTGLALCKLFFFILSLWLLFQGLSCLFRCYVFFFSSFDALMLSRFDLQQVLSARLGSDWLRRPQSRTYITHTYTSWAVVVGFTGVLAGSISLLQGLQNQKGFGGYLDFDLVGDEGMTKNMDGWRDLQPGSSAGFTSKLHFYCTAIAPETKSAFSTFEF